MAPTDGDHSKLWVQDCKYLFKLKLKSGPNKRSNKDEIHFWDIAER